MLREDTRNELTAEVLQVLGWTGQGSSDSKERIADLQEGWVGWGGVGFKLSMSPGLEY